MSENRHIFSKVTSFIVALISAAFAYVICLIIGYIARWVYNKYLK